MNETLNYHAFLVGREPFCIWDPDMAARNLEFLDSIDSGFFTFLATAHGERLEGEDRKRAAIASRMAYYHGLETLFALLAAAVQAPQSAYAWMSLYRITDLRYVLEGISRCDPSLHSDIEPWDRSWHGLAKMVMSGAPDDPTWRLDTAREFGRLWSVLSAHMADKMHQDEYNSLKHGFRVRAGGFHLAVGKEHEYGASPPQAGMVSLGGSKYGTSFFDIGRAGPAIEGNRSRRSRRSAINWSPETNVRALQLIDISIGNVVAFIKSLNGISTSELQYFRPEVSESYEGAWRDAIGVRSFNMDVSYSDEVIPATTRKELRENIQRGLEEMKSRAAKDQDGAIDQEGAK